MILRNCSDRIARLRACFIEWGVKSVLIENSIDLFYLTGCSISTGSLVISNETATLWVDGRYFASLKTSPEVVVRKLSAESFCNLLATVPTPMGIDSETTCIHRGREIETLCQQVVPVRGMTSRLRAIKDKGELEALDRSEAILFEGLSYIRSQLTEGIQEIELALKFELFCRKRGADRLSFDPIIAFGKNAAYPHHRAGKSRLQKGEVVLCDVGVVLDHYHSDMTRTWFYGIPQPSLKLLYEAVIKAHGAAVRACRSGIQVGELDRIATEEIEKRGMSQFLAHGLGHGIGLEVHEFPRVKKEGLDHQVILEEGMTITIEPGLYIPEVGGIRIEDRIVVTSDGCQGQFLNQGL